MAEKEIKWTRTADKQLQDTLEYWVERNESPAYAIKILSLVDQYIQRIVLQPQSFRLTEYGNHRVCVMGRFSIYFRAGKRIIYITCFWDNRQNPKRLRGVLGRTREK